MVFVTAEAHVVAAQRGAGNVVNGAVGELVWRGDA